MMKDVLEKGLFAGLGFLAMTRDEAETILDRLVERGKLSAEGAEAVAREIAEQGRKKAASVEKSAADLVEAFLAKAPYVKTDEFKKLNERVRKLEARLKPAPKSPVAKKRTAAKRRTHGNTGS